MQLRIPPELDSWDRNDHPATIRLRAYLDDTEALIGSSKILGPWALRLDVGRPPLKDLLDKADLDNYAFPLAKRLRDADLVSVWCTKQHGAHSCVRLAAAREVPAPAEVLAVETTASWESRGGGSPAQEQIIAAVAAAAEMPAGPVRLELSFLVGPRRNWLKLWKPTIDSLDSLLGRTYPGQPRNPLDGRITELGLHVAVDPRAGNNVVIGIHAGTGSMRVSPHGRGEPGVLARIDQPDCDGTGTNGVAVVHDSSSDAVRVPGLGGDARLFRGDDAGYLAWLSAHPDGYVINIVRGYSPADARLHRVRCRHINGRSRGVWTEGQYVKICADRLSDLDQWAAAAVGEPIEPCRSCNPGTGST